MNDINNYHYYRHEMSKGMEEKLFFLEHVSFNTLLDYGCADGSLIQTISENFGTVPCFGFDFDEKMIQFALSKNIPNTYFSNNLNELTQLIQSQGVENNLVLCSSLIHEVYSYGNEQSIKDFWNYLFSGFFKYIVIRDMSLSKSVLKQKTTLDDLKKIRLNANPKHYDEFVEQWGSLNERLNFIHYLMKYRYIDNWSREVLENYFPLTMEDYIHLIPSAYKIIFKEHQSLPFIKHQIEKDFGIHINDKTHLKLILERKF
jgi:hypothetical protein